MAWARQSLFFAVPGYGERGQYSIFKDLTIRGWTASLEEHAQNGALAAKDVRVPSTFVARRRALCAYRAR